MFCGLFLVNPVGQHINLHTHAWWDDGSLMVRLKPYRRYILAVSFVGSVAVLVLDNHHSIEQMLWSMVVMFAMVIAGTWNSTLVSMLNMLGFRAASVLWSIITIAISLASSILLVLWSPSAIAWFAGQAIGMAVGAIGAKYVLQQHTLSTKSAQGDTPLLNRHTALTYCLPLALATGLMWLQLSGYRIVIESYWGLAQLGFLVVGLSLSGQIWSLVESLSMQFLYPLFYRRVSSHENEMEIELAFSDILNTLIPVYFVLTGLVVISAPYLLKLLVARQFQDAVVFVMLGAGIELCRVLGNLLSKAAHVRRKTKSLTLPYAGGAITTLVLIYLAGIWQMEIVWAVVAILIGALVTLMIMWIGMRKQVRFTVDYARWLWGGGVMLVMTVLVTWMPNVIGLGASIAILTLIAIPVGIAILSLLWKNPATLRLLNVQLKKN
jgi:O-antigen/teichoic acid export membrane protein